MRKMFWCAANSHFQDWAEAWLVFASLHLQFPPERVGQLISYFLQISKIHRDSYSEGWLAYDRAFRKKVVENPRASWSDIDLNLFVSNVFQKFPKS